MDYGESFRIHQTAQRVGVICLTFVGLPNGLGGVIQHSLGSPMDYGESFRIHQVDQSRADSVSMHWVATVQGVLKFIKEHFYIKPTAYWTVAHVSHHLKFKTALLFLLSREPSTNT